MALGDRYLRSATAAAERLTGDRILRVAFAARPGAMAAFVGGQLAGAGEGLGSTGGRAPGAKIMRDEGKDTKLPANFLLAVTPTRIHVYKHRMGYGRVKIKGELGVFDREGLEVDVQEGKLTKRFTLHSPSAGQTMAFEMNRHRVTTELAEELGSAAGARTP